MATSTHPATIGLMEYRFITKNGLPLICFLTYKEDTQEKLHLVHALACGTDIIEILHPTAIEQIEAEALVNRYGCHAIVAFVDMRPSRELPSHSGMRAEGWLG